ncbi:MAG TPA: hypothetical protein VMU39_12765 [Solirubrobacteraceae bacterium]|nr:hypothetical protein [Solirubrobacteraceae bacterium]
MPSCSRATTTGRALVIVSAFKFKTFPEYGEHFHSDVAWHEPPGKGHGQNILTVEIDERYRTDAVKCAESTVRELATEEELDLANLDMLIATASVRGFASALAQSLGTKAARIVALPDGLAHAHTAALAIALESVQLADSRTAVLVCAGAGMTVVAALYRP